MKDGVKEDPKAKLPGKRLYHYQNVIKRLMLLFIEYF
jgi:hypothetical protein